MLSPYRNALRRNFERMGPILKEFGEESLTGPHHVGSEIDLEFQASHNAAWRTWSSVLFWAGVAAGGYALYSSGAGGKVAAVIAGAGLLGSVLAGAMSKTIASRALTETHPALRGVVGDTGGWSPVSREEMAAMGPITLPDGTVLEPADVKPMKYSDVVAFKRYPKVEILPLE
jgi:hypothetical protein